MKELHYFQHVPFEGLGVIEQWAQKKGFSLSSTQFFKDQKISMPDNTDWLVVMGGPMSVNDQDKYPWLKAEKLAIEHAIKKDIVVMGICLGAQLIAEVLGAGVKVNDHKEIGWFGLSRDSHLSDHSLADIFPSQWDALHWHGETFDIPGEARLLASSTACHNQGFVYKEKVLGLQFHLEVTRSGADALVQNCAEDLTVGDFISTRDEIVSSDAPFDASHDLMIKLLDHMNTLS